MDKGRETLDTCINVLQNDPIDFFKLCNHQFSKMLVLQIKIDDRAVMLIYTIGHIVTGIPTLI